MNEKEYINSSEKLFHISIGILMCRRELLERRFFEIDGKSFKVGFKDKVPLNYEELLFQIVFKRQDLVYLFLNQYSFLFCQNPFC
jgi:hypothetical protein